MRLAYTLQVTPQTTSIRLLMPFIRTRVPLTMYCKFASARPPNPNTRTALGQKAYVTARRNMEKVNTDVYSARRGSRDVIAKYTYGQS